MQNNSYSIAIAAGGTGGHISPAVSILLHLLNKHSTEKVNFFFFTLHKNKDYADIIAVSKLAKVKVIYYSAPKIPKNPKELILFFKHLYFCVQSIRKSNLQIPIRLCIGTGGFPSFPLIFWSLLKRVPYCLCEQNKLMGFANKIMSLRAKKVFLSFPQKKYKTQEVFTGNPLRQPFWTLPKVPQKVSPQIKNILILGGSQGASQLNNIYLLLIYLPEFKDTNFTVSTGPQDYKEILKKARIQDTILPFIHDVKNALLQHNLIISRAGSSSLFEIIWSQKPSILIPYPYASNQHQKENAYFLKKQKVAEVIDIEPFSEESAIKKIQYLFKSDFYKNAQTRYLEQTQCLPINAHETISQHIMSILSN